LNCHCTKFCHRNLIISRSPNSNFHPKRAKLIFTKFLCSLFLFFVWISRVSLHPCFLFFIYYALFFCSRTRLITVRWINNFKPLLLLCFSQLHNASHGTGNHRVETLQFSSCVVAKSSNRRTKLFIRALVISQIWRKEKNSREEKKRKFEGEEKLQGDDMIITEREKKRWKRTLEKKLSCYSASSSTIRVVIEKRNAFDLAILWP